MGSAPRMKAADKNQRVSRESEETGVYLVLALLSGPTGGKGPRKRERERERERDSESDQKMCTRT